MDPYDLAPVTCNADHNRLIVIGFNLLWAISFLTTFMTIMSKATVIEALTYGVNSGRLPVRGALTERGIAAVLRRRSKPANRIGYHECLDRTMQ